MRFRGRAGRRHGHHYGQGDPRAALFVPFIWMFLVCILSFVTIIVTATNSNNENTKVITGFEAVFFILMYITMCNLIKTDRFKMPKTFKAYFCIFLIFAACLIIFCSLNITLVQSVRPPILTMTLVQTGLALGFTICSVFCCFLCNFNQALTNQQQQAAAASTNIRAQQRVDAPNTRLQQLEQNRRVNMVNMYQQQLQNQFQQAQQNMTPEQIAQQQQQLAFLQQQHQIMMQQLQQQMLMQQQQPQAGGAQGANFQSVLQQQPFPALYQPQFLAVNQQWQQVPNQQQFPMMMQPGANALQQQPGQYILPIQNN